MVRFASVAWGAIASLLLISCSTDLCITAAATRASSAHFEDSYTSGTRNNGFSKKQIDVHSNRLRWSHSPNRVVSALSIVAGIGAIAFLVLYCRDGIISNRLKISSGTRVLAENLASECSTSIAEVASDPRQELSVPLIVLQINLLDVSESDCKGLTNMQYGTIRESKRQLENMLLAFTSLRSRVEAYANRMEAKAASQTEKGSRSQVDAADNGHFGESEELQNMKKQLEKLTAQLIKLQWTHDQEPHSLLMRGTLLRKNQRISPKAAKALTARRIVFRGTGDFSASLSKDDTEKVLAVVEDVLQKAKTCIAALDNVSLPNSKYIDEAEASLRDLLEISSYLRWYKLNNEAARVGMAATELNAALDRKRPIPGEFS